MRLQSILLFDFQFSHDSGEILILIGRDQVDSGAERRTPTFQNGLARTKVIGLIPPAILLGAETVKCIEADPESESMGVTHECLKAMHVGRCPVAGADLATFLDLRPGVVPPSAIVCGPLYQQLIRWKRGRKMRPLTVGVSRKSLCMG